MFACSFTFSVDRLAVNLVRADFAAVRKHSEKNLSCFLEIDITSVIDVNTPDDDKQLFSSLS